MIIEREYEPNNVFVIERIHAIHICILLKNECLTSVREWKKSGMDSNDNEDITKDNEWFPEHTFPLKFSLCSHS